MLTVLTSKGISLFYLLVTFAILSLFVLNISSCDDEEVPNMETFVECPVHLGALVDQFFESTWTKENIQSFIEGRWRLHRVESAETPDSVRVSILPFEREIRFLNPNIIEIYEPYDQFLGSSEYELVESRVNSELNLYRIELSSAIQSRYVIFGTMIPCASELVIYRSDVDQVDWFYRKVE